MKATISLLFILILSFCVAGQQDNKTAPQSERRILNFPKPEQLFQLLEGKWIFAGMSCAEPYTVTVSADRKSIKFQYAKPQKWKDGTLHDSFSYKVLEVGGYFIRTQIEGESRKTIKGDPVAWDFMFLSPNEFVWHRADWEGLSSTESVTRCDDEKRRGSAVAGDSEGAALPVDVRPPAGTGNSLSGGILNGKALMLVKPEYPAAARAVRAVGSVNVRVTIDEQGNVTSAAAISGNPFLRQASEKAALASKFAPTILEGQAVQVTGVIVYNFAP